MKYIIKQQAINSICSFYDNTVNKAHKHVYSLSDYNNFVDKTYNDAMLIGTKTDKVKSNINTKMLNTKLFQEWAKSGYLVAASKKWYYAYTINGDTIIVHDACHKQNNESQTINTSKKSLYESIMRDVSKIVKMHLKRL